MSSSFPNDPTPPVSDQVISDALRALAKALDDGDMTPPSLPEILIPAGYGPATLYGALRIRNRKAWSDFTALVYTVIQDRPGIDIALVTDVSAYFTDSGSD